VLSAFSVVKIRRLNDAFQCRDLTAR